MTAISIRGLVAGYGQDDILRGVDLEVESGTITCVIGPNGAGKSTVLKAISGLVRCRARQRSRSAARRSPAARARQVLELGVVHVPQERSLFPLMTVWDNVLIGGHVLRDQRRRAPPRRGARRALPAHPRAPARPRRRALGRPAEARRDRPRAAARAQGHPHGRAVDGPRPEVAAHRSSRRSAPSTTAGARCCSSSRTRAPGSRSPTAARSWTPASCALAAPSAGAAQRPARRRAVPRRRAECRASARLAEHRLDGPRLQSRVAPESRAALRVPGGVGRGLPLPTLDRKASVGATTGPSRPRSAAVRPAPDPNMNVSRQAILPCRRVRKLQLAMVLVRPRCMYRQARRRSVGPAASAARALRALSDHPDIPHGLERCPNRAAAA